MTPTSHSPEPSTSAPLPEAPDAQGAFAVRDALPDSPHQEAGTGSRHAAGSAETVNVLQSLILESADVQEFLTGFAILAAERLTRPGLTVRCGVTLLRTKKHGTVASSDATARRMDELQYSHREGPCLAASLTQTMIYVPDTTRDERWPSYFQAINGYGVRSILAVPIPLDGEASCALNLYATAADAFDDTGMGLAQQFAGEAAMGLRLAVRIAHLTDVGQNLTSAMHSRTIIDLAAGIIMAQNRCSQEQAMMILKAASSSRNMKLREVAAAVVRSTNTEAPSTHFDA